MRQLADLQTAKSRAAPMVCPAMAMAREVVGERSREEDGEPHLQVLDVVTRPGMELESMLIVILVT